MSRLWFSDIDVLYMELTYVLYVLLVSAFVLGKNGPTWIVQYDDDSTVAEEMHFKEVQAAMELFHTNWRPLVKAYLDLKKSTKLPNGEQRDIISESKSESRVN